MSEPASPPSTPEGLVDLLALLAYGELTAFSRLAADADLAPALSAKAALGRLATIEYGHFELLRARLAELVGDPDAAMEPFVAAVDAYHDRTAPTDWLEGLVKAYVGDGIASDFYREIAARLDPAARDLITEVLHTSATADFVVATVRAEIERDPRVAGRLALWGRRLVGEALSQAQRVAADREGLTAMVVGVQAGTGGDLTEVVAMFSRLTERHSERMQRLGLTA